MQRYAIVNCTFKINKYYDKKYQASLNFCMKKSSKPFKTIKILRHFYYTCILFILINRLLTKLIFKVLE